MELLDCLEALQGYGVTLQRRGSGLFIQSATTTPTTHQKATISTHKPLLLAILPDGDVVPVGLVMDAVEAYTERTAIMQQDTTLSASVIETTAQAQARCVFPVPRTPCPKGG